MTLASPSDTAPSVSITHLMVNARVGRTAIASILLGTTGFIVALSIFQFTDLLVEAMGELHDHTALITAGIVLALLAAGLFGMLIFYGGRLLRRWKQLAHPSNEEMKLIGGVLQDLVRVRIVAAGLMAITIVPFAVPTMVTDFGLATVLFFTMTVVFGLLLLAARRAVWDIALSLGASYTPGAGQAFPVLMPGMAAAPIRTLPAAVLPPIAGAPTPPRQAIPLPALTMQWQDDAPNLRDWETALYAVLLLMIGVGASQLSGLPSQWREAVKLSSWTELYSQYAAFSPGSRPAYGYPSNVGYGTPSLGISHPVNGIAACTFFASTMLLATLRAMGLFWALICLTFGPRLRSLANVLSFVAIILVITQIFGQVIALRWLMNDLLKYRMYSNIELAMGSGSPVAEAAKGMALPLMVVIILTRRPVLALFRFRPRQPKTS